MAGAGPAFPPSGAPYNLDWRDRPPELKKKIDSAFDALQGDSSSKWGIYNGEREYGLSGVEEYALMKRVILGAPPTQKEFWALDIGAGNFQWGMGLERFLDSQIDLPEGVHVHIVSLRGEPSLEEREFSTDLCTLHNLGAFKIEDLALELRKLGLNLENRVDFAVSRWCFRHLVDPVGTFAQTFNLLRPGTGIFSFDGFFFEIKGNRKSMQQANLLMVQLLQDTNAPFLKRYYDGNHSLDHFLLQRPDATPCQLPMRYTNIRKVTSGWQINSRTIIQFQRETANGEEEGDSLSNERFYQELIGNKQLYELLKQRGLFCGNPPIWEPMRAEDDVLMTPPLHAAVRAGDVSAAIASLEAGDDINASDGEGNTAVHVAILCQNERMLRALLGRRPSFTVRDAGGLFPLHLAAKIDTEGPLIHALLEHEANKNAELKNFSTQYLKGFYSESERCETPLDCAIGSANKKAIEILLEAGAEVSERNRAVLEARGHIIPHEPKSLRALCEAAAEWW